MEVGVDLWEGARKREKSFLSDIGGLFACWLVGWLVGCVLCSMFNPSIRISIYRKRRKMEDH